MESYGDLEIGIHRQDAENYRVELRYTDPESQAEVRLIKGDSSFIQLNTNHFYELIHDDKAYGAHLTHRLFNVGEMKEAFAKALINSQTKNHSLRVRLFVGPSAPELHNLRWETLQNPLDSLQLSTTQKILFSRYLSSYDWNPVRLRPQSKLRALIVIANPTDIDTYEPGGIRLDPINIKNESERIKASMGDIDIKELSNGNATLAQIMHHLQAGFDILYIICHGAFIDCQPRLWLENEMGASEVIRGEEMVIRLSDIRDRPRLIVLASCTSAGDTSHACVSSVGTLSALGPMLAESGIPAVVAMQGTISVQTIQLFMPAFFSALQEHGVVDSAMSVARSRVKEQPDWWMPVLYMRLKSGRIWYSPGFADQSKTLKKMPSLLRNIENRKCTPIIGPGIIESLFGSRREIARRWAETFHFPMYTHQQEDLPQVAQYLAIDQDQAFPKYEFVNYLKGEMLYRYKDILENNSADTPLSEMVSRVARTLRKNSTSDPHLILAQLPVEVFITTTFNHILADVLKDVGKKPHVEFCRWNEDLEQYESIYDQYPKYRPSVENPLVFHLFGHLGIKESLVLTENDYFDYLIGTSRNKMLIPKVVSRALSDSALLFLGFQMGDWDFRVLFRSMMQSEGSRRRLKYAHVAVQLDPEEDRIIEPTAAREFLEQYFLSSDLNIYWGRPLDFLDELWQNYEKRVEG